ncbi:hypothetical protein HDV00_012570 [Rhizophlyctis rosea]|nr:hypothetical protein HDV00_012570 [Rhizophlyctis rosea]
MKTIALLCLSATAGVVPTLAAANILKLPQYIEIATTNNYGLDPITSVLVIEGDNITHDKAKDVCKEQNESLATYDPSNPHGVDVAVHRFNGSRTQYWINQKSTGSTYRKPSTCPALSTDGHSSQIINVPCSKNLPVICTNSAPGTTTKSWVEGSKPLVKVDAPAGTIIGTRDILSWRFLSIPYAKPPTGKRRFALPVAKERLHDFKALKVGPRCHPNGFLDSPANNYAEDCLSLHVFTPRVGKNLKGKALPVLVDIHGGGGTAGGADDLISAQTGTFASRNNLVVVKLQYRMAMMGVFEDTTTYNRQTLSGNQYIHDQILALKWVQKNIAHFGGNPSQVVITGQSSGGWHVRNLVSSPLAHGLFRRAIMRSDGQGPAQPPAVSSQMGKVFMAKAGCKTLDCMRKAPFERLIEAQKEVPGATGIPYYTATLDGTTVPDQFNKLLAAGKFNKVPMIFTGTNNEQGSNNMPSPLPQSAALALLQNLTPAATPDLIVPLMIGVYGANPDPNSDWSLPTSRLITEGSGKCPQRYNAILASAHVPIRVASVYTGMRASFSPPALCHDQWICHSDDNAVTNGYTQYDLPSTTYNYTEATPHILETSRQYGDIISAFARSSDEEVKGEMLGGYAWPLINATKHDGVLFGVGEKWEDGVQRGGYGDLPCDVFDQLGIYPFLV